MIFAQFLQHPLATDPVTKQPTGGYDTTKMIDATGSDSYVQLDARFGRRRQIQETVRVWEERKDMNPGIVGFEIRSGSLLRSKLVYRASFDSLPKAPVRIDGGDIVGQIRDAVGAGAKVTMLDDETLTRLASTPDGLTSSFGLTLLRQISLTATALEQIAQVMQETGIAYGLVPEEPGTDRGTYVMLQTEPNQDFTAVLARFTELWGPRRTLNHALEIGDVDDGEGGTIGPHETFDGFKIGGCLIIQCDTGSEETIQIYPSMNPEPQTV